MKPERAVYLNKMDQWKELQTDRREALLRKSLAASIPSGVNISMIADVPNPDFDENDNDSEIGWSDPNGKYSTCRIRSSMIMDTLLRLAVLNSIDREIAVIDIRIESCLVPLAGDCQSPVLEMEEHIGK